MFFETDIRGDRLPLGTVCFTYDDGPGCSAASDGPGPRTAQLGAFLHAEGVPATFFAVGRFAAQLGEVLAGLRSLGHLVANHTFTHPSLPAFVAAGSDVCGELARTDEAIRDHVESGSIFFRAPYGDWRLRGQARSNVAAVLNRSELASSHVGPIGWDIDAGDVGFWRDERSPEDCAHAYLAAIEQVGRGIVLMHDSTADIDEIRPRNQALRLARALVPELRSRGYRFVRLDAVPQVASAVRVGRQVSLAAADGRLVWASAEGSNVGFAAPLDAGADAIWGVDELGADRWALRSPHGLFLSPQRQGYVVADAVAPRAREILKVEQQAEGRIALRTIDGTYLRRDPNDGARLRADSTARGEAETWTLVHPFPP